MTGTITIYAYTWAFYAYMIVVPLTAVAVAYTSYKYGYGKGYKQGVADEQNRVITPTRFRQRTAEADPRRHSVVRNARMIARRQPRPEPRRGKPRDS